MEAGLGARPTSTGGCAFTVWAPRAGRVEAHVLAPVERIVALHRDEWGYHRGEVADIGAGALYRYRLDGERELPDPASRLQPQGVHGPSAVVDTAFQWSDEEWRGLPLADHVFYELHVGAYTEQGTFAGVIPHLPDLAELGVTALELMPVGQFPGTRNWGYDGVYPFAAQNSYGGPRALAGLVDACHGHGLAVVLDVVYNHLGPEGNVLVQYGPYFTDRYRTPWGPAVNFDGPDSDHVRRFFIENALSWVRDFHVDGLRLDAVHAIVDRSPRPFLGELEEAVHGEAARLGRPVHLFPESADNDARLVRGPEFGGYGLDAVWSDDFHHAVHALLTGEQDGYYQDYGALDHLVRVFRDGFAYTGQYSTYRRRRHGSRCDDIPRRRFIVFAQNHDQVGNRARGERLSTLVPFEALKLAAGLVALSPFLPLLFMGEEYGEEAPFPYFVSLGAPDLVEAVRRGRRAEFASFVWLGEIPDPQAEETFRAARLDRRGAERDGARKLRDFYRAVLRLRRGERALGAGRVASPDVRADVVARTLLVLRDGERGQLSLLAHFGERAEEVTLPLPAGQWLRLLDSADERFGGPGSLVPAEIAAHGQALLTLPPWSVAVLRREAG
jgi:maltooligosyltrehalose trehalohydrolase